MHSYLKMNNYKLQLFALQSQQIVSKHYQNTYILKEKRFLQKYAVVINRQKKFVMYPNVKIVAIFQFWLDVTIVNLALT